MKKLLLILMYASFAFSDVKVAVAANVSYAMEELIAKFNEKYQNIKITPVFSGSGSLTAQIINQAPFGIFMSADMKYPQNLYEKGFSSTKPVVYAQGQLAIFSKNNEALSKDLKGLLHVKNIAIANPDTAPYGRASVESFKKQNIYEKLKPKLVYAQSISQTLSYALNATSVGLVAKSALYSPKMKQYKKNTHWVEVDESLYSPIKQGIIIIKAYENDEDVRKFYDFILSDEAKKIFKSYGYSE